MVQDLCGQGDVLVKVSVIPNILTNECELERLLHHPPALPSYSAGVVPPVRPGWEYNGYKLHFQGRKIAIQGQYLSMLVIVR